ncbi:hypothetical protein PR048_004746 [Dryococelus australis]|uniref:Tudor domain-containing protein n=1 Tax=Dryococelus australis TaxID=614101 RepID=A0ABQ9I697_9NEOP|nr:hypothetical protein PR048_004746 [Dryococelus australis]
MVSKDTIDVLIVNFGGFQMSGLSEDILYFRGNGQDSEALDDSVLLNTYDRHFSNIRKKVLQRMGYSNSEVNEVLRPGAKQKQKQQKSPKQPPRWSVGAHCCSVFIEDGNVYEATITELNPESGTCRIQYVGYDNEEEVEISSLTPSRGRKARGTQILDAVGTEFSNGECSDNCSEDESVQVNIPQQKVKSLKNSRQKRVPHIPPNATEGTPHIPFQPGMGMPRIKMPRFNGMPPVMPSIVPPMPFNMMEYSAEPAEAFSAMLMSWYMNGYYTGYYEALKARRRKQNNKK